jgi:putative ATP-dependent endonuclease of OLD family
MYLAAIDIKHFRSFKELHVDLEQGLNVLVGRNNTGKTNLLKAIRHAIGPNASRGEALWLDRDDFYKESASDSTDRSISVTLTFHGLSEDQRAYFYEIVDFDLANLSNSKAIIKFEAVWPKDKRQPSIKRTGGPPVAEPPEVPSRILESLPITFLPALRDAEAALAPGYRSRLASLLLDLAKRGNPNFKEEVLAIFTQANVELEQRPLISDTKKSLQSTTGDLAGTDYAASAIKVAPAEFEKILRTLQVQMDGAPIGDLDANGLGYNNLLYMAVVLEHLNPILLIEEPEAHLHPQLTMLLADYLANKTPGKTTPQTIVTTHSPTLVASVPPNRVHLLFCSPRTNQIQCNSITKAGMDDIEQNQLQRMMDITRSTLYFAKGAILVEGISEALLVPVLAERCGHSLSALHISVIPICGVAFETFKKLLDLKVLGIPVAIVTDADPKVPTDVPWKEALPEPDNGSFKLSDRTRKLLELFGGHSTVRVFHSTLTLEYDLAEASDSNATVMAKVWEDCFVGTPRTFNRELVNTDNGSKKENAIIAWRGICRAEHSGSKAEFAHRLAASLATRKSDSEFEIAFETPAYITQAIDYVVGSVTTHQSVSETK